MKHNSDKQDVKEAQSQTVAQAIQHGHYITIEQKDAVAQIQGGVVIEVAVLRHLFELQKSIVQAASAVGLAVIPCAFIGDGKVKVLFSGKQDDASGVVTAKIEALRNLPTVHGAALAAFEAAPEPASSPDEIDGTAVVEEVGQQKDTFMKTYAKGLELPGVTVDPEMKRLLESRQTVQATHRLAVNAHKAKDAGFDVYVGAEKSKAVGTDYPDRLKVDPKPPKARESFDITEADIVGVDAADKVIVFSCGRQLPYEDAVPKEFEMLREGTITSWRVQVDGTVSILKVKPLKTKPSP